MLCPFCLKDVRFKLARPQGSPVDVYQCPEDGEQIPSMYVRDHRAYPPTVISAVGFPAHGKTTYFASLFYAFRKLDLPRYWPNFFTTSLNEETLETIGENIQMLQQGKLPESTRVQFPRPTMLRIHGVPNLRNSTLLCYDTGGEAFEKPTQLVTHAKFVMRARTVVFLVSLPTLADPSTEMDKLLNTYVIGMETLGGLTRDQHLIVVYTKADTMLPAFTGEWADLKEFLLQGGVENLARLDSYMRGMSSVDSLLKNFTAKELNALNFLNLAKDRFRSVTFSMISALGSSPNRVNNELPVQVAPRRLLDPLLWAIKKSDGGLFSFFK